MIFFGVRPGCCVSISSIAKRGRKTNPPKKARLMIKLFPTRPSKGRKRSVSLVQLLLLLLSEVKAASQQARSSQQTFLQGFALQTFPLTKQQRRLWSLTSPQDIRCTDEYEIAAAIWQSMAFGNLWLISLARPFSLSPFGFRLPKVRHSLLFLLPRPFLSFSREDHRTASNEGRTASNFLCLFVCRSFEAGF